MATRDASSARPGVVIVSTSHGTPPTQPRPWRRFELLRILAARGADVESILLLERPLSTPERGRGMDGADALLRSAERVVRDPAAFGLLGRLIGGAARRWSSFEGRARDLGLRPLAAELRRCARGRRPHLIIVGSPRLAGLARRAPPGCRIVLDAPRLEAASRARLRAVGREDALESLAGAEDPEAFSRFDAILVSSRRDGRRLAAAGVDVPCLVVPPTAPIPREPLPTATARSPRILFVGSETVANLDAIRWFRRRVLPRVRRAVPACRLRIVGEAGRHITAGDDCERVGWIDDLEPEFARSCVVALPLRLDGGVRRRAVEALARGRTLAVTSAIAEEMELGPGRDAIASDDERRLAAGIVEAITNRRIREIYEARARDIARARFAPLPAMEPLLDLLAEPGPSRPGPGVRRVAAEPVT